MSNFQMKRFEQMKDSKQTIIDGTNKRLQQKAHQTPVIYYVSLAILLFVLCISGYLLLQQQTGEEQTISARQNLNASLVSDMKLLVQEGELTLIIAEETVKTIAPLNEYVSSTLVVHLTEAQTNDLQIVLDIQLEQAQMISGIFMVENLYKEGQRYYAENVRYVYNVTPEPFIIQFNEEKEIVLETKLYELYTEFKETLDTEQLRALTPVDVFYLYEYAVQQDAVDVVYALINPSEDTYKPMYEVFVEEFHRNKEYGSGIHPFYGKEISIEYRDFDGRKEAFLVEVSENDDYVFFGLTQSEDGIWFVNFNPMQ